MPPKKAGSKRTARSKPALPQVGSRTSEADLSALISGHGPRDWKREISLSSLSTHLGAEKPVNMIVLAADIRRSTFLMKEAVNFKTFATIIGDFVEAARDAMRGARGWFDKFTGDGFLGYWLYGERELGTYISILFRTCHSLLYHFQEVVMDQLRRNSKNFPTGVGLSLGIDGGPGHLVTVARDLTVVGAPVVGAVRMVSSALLPWETLCNVYLGEALYRARGQLQREEIEVLKEFRQTKEYEQEVYRIVFHKSLGAIRVD